MYIIMSSVPLQKCHIQFPIWNNTSYVHCFNSIKEMKISDAKLICICESSISYVKYMFRTLRFHMWNFEPVHFTYKLGFSYMKTFRFHIWSENFTSENVLFHIFHMWNDMWSCREDVNRVYDGVRIKLCELHQAIFLYLEQSTNFSTCSSTQNVQF